MDLGFSISKNPRGAKSIQSRRYYIAYYETPTTERNTMSIKKKAVATKDFVKKHRVAIAVVVTSACWIAIARHNAKQVDEFLVGRGINPDEYWTDESV